MEAGKLGLLLDNYRMYVKITLINVFIYKRQ